VQTIPDFTIRSDAESTCWEKVPGSSVNKEKNPVPKNHRIPLNKMMRKFGVDTRMRCEKAEADKEAPPS
jgi:hypothetical protein